MKNIKISVLIPVYNTERYLRKCLDSVLAQTLKEIEIIITNDGATDNSQKIIEEYAIKDKRIRYNIQKNSGLGATRNKGIELAKGEYIAFLDSDDWVEKDYYKFMYEEAKKNNVDLVVSNFCIDSKSKLSVYRHNENNKKRYLQGVIERRYPGFSWNKLYKKSLIDNNHIRFPIRDELENIEDQYFTIRTCCFAKNIAFIDNPLIHYVIRDSSITNKYQKTLLRDGIAFYRDNVKLFHSLNIYQEFEHSLNINMIKHMCQLMSNECRRGNENSIRKRIKIFKNILDIEEYRNILLKFDAEIKKDNKFYKQSISRETKFYMKLLFEKRIVTLFLIKYFRIKYIEFKNFKFL